MNLETLKTAALIALIVIAVVGILLAIIIRKIIGKIISLVLAAVLVFLFWQQRDKVTDAAQHLQNSSCSSAASAEEEMPSFLGIDISLPDDWCQS